MQTRMLSVSCTAACIVTVAMLAGGCPSPDPLPDPGPELNEPVPKPLPAEQFALTVTLQGEGSVTPANGTFDSGTTVTLVATAKEGYAFNHWEGALTGATNPATLAIGADTSVTAVFVKQFELVLDTEGLGVVTVHTADGSVSSASFFDAGIQLRLTAEPGEGWAFVTWKGEVSGSDEKQNPLTMTLDADRTITAVFARQYVLTVETDGAGRVEPAGGDFVDGTDLELTATPDEGYMFARWSGDVPPGSELDNPVQLTTDGDRTVTAIFFKADLIPGVGVGPLRLGDKWTDVADLLGAPDDLWPSPYTWTVFFEYNWIGIHGCLDDSDHDENADPDERVSGLWAYDPFPGTYQGLGIGSSKDEVVNALGPPEEINGDGYWYWSRGIHWGFSGSEAHDIYVFEPH
jgi:hypothetical protein